MAEMSGAQRSIKVAMGGAFLLTMATWIYFYKTLPDAPALGAQGTTIVFGAWFCAVFAAHWAWRRLHRKSRKRG